MVAIQEEKYMPQKDNIDKMNDELSGSFSDEIFLIFR